MLKYDIKRWGPHEWDQCLYKEAPERFLALITIGEHSIKAMVMTEEALLKGDHADTLILAFQFPEVHEISLCCLQTTEPVMFCYRSSNRLR